MFFVSGMAFANWLARIPSVRERLGIGDRVLGFVLLGTAAGALLAFRCAGPLILRWGSRRVTWGSAAAFCALLPFPGLADTAAGATAALFILGAASGLMDVGMNAQAVEVEQRLGRPVLSKLHGIFSLGALAGAGMGSLAAAAAVPTGPHLLCVAVLLLMPVLLAGSALVPEDSDREVSVGVGKPSGTLLALGAVAFCSSVGEGAMADWTAVYLREILRTGMGTAGLGYAMYSLAMVIGRFAGDRLTTHFGPVRVVRAGGIAVAGGLGLGLALNSVPAMMFAALCVGGGLSIVVPVVFRAGGQLRGIAPGAALATLATLSYSGFLVGPPAIGFIAEEATLRGGLAVVVVLAVVLALLAPAVGKGERRPSRHAVLHRPVPSASEHGGHPAIGEPAR
jgi:MFS family permease